MVERSRGATVQSSIRDAARRVAAAEAARAPVTAAPRPAYQTVPPPPPPPLAPPPPPPPARRPGPTPGVLVALVLAVAGALTGAVMLLAGDGDGAPARVAPSATTTRSQVDVDRQRAAAIMLTVADLPGYAVEPEAREPEDPDFVAQLAACANGNPLVRQLIQGDTSRGAVSQGFRKGQGEYAVSSGVTFAESAALASAAIRDGSGPSVAACLNRVRSDEPISGWTTVSVTTTRLPTLTAGDENVGYRTVIRTRPASSSRIVTFSFGFTFVRADRALVLLYDAATDGQLPEFERARLVALLAGRAAG